MPPKPTDIYTIPALEPYATSFDDSDSPLVINLPIDPYYHHIINAISPNEASLKSKTKPPEPHPVPVSENIPLAFLRKKVPKKKKEDVFYNRNILSLAKEYNGGLTKVSGGIGLEIECEGMHLYTTPLRWWNTHIDSSLRKKNGHDPVEYTLKEPLSRSDLTKALVYLSKGLQKAKSEPDLESYRTSVHVHINVQDMTLKEILTFVSLYILFEKALVKFCGQTREGNLFCLRAIDAGYWIYSINNMLQQSSLASLCNDSNRYVSCNLSSLTKFGSTEFRSMRGTVDISLIEDWVDILLAIKDFSKEFDSPLSLYRFSRTAPVSLIVDSVLGTKLTGKLSGIDLQDSFDSGSEYVRDIAQAVPEWLPALTEEDIGKKKITKEERLSNAQHFGAWVSNPYAMDKKFCFKGSEKLSDIPANSYIYYDSDGLIAVLDGMTSVVKKWLVED